MLPVKLFSAPLLRPKRLLIRKTVKQTKRVHNEYASRVRILIKTIPWNDCYATPHSAQMRPEQLLLLPICTVRRRCPYVTPATGFRFRCRKRHLCRCTRRIVHVRRPKTIKTINIARPPARTSNRFGGGGGGRRFSPNGLV